MSAYLQTVVDAFSVGAVYSLLAVALVVVYRASRSVNFGQGEIGTFGAFTVLSLVGLAVPLPVALGIGLVLGFAICAAAYYFVVRHTRAHAESTTILVGTALFLGINSLAGVLWDTNTHSFPGVFPGGPGDFAEVGAVRVYAGVIGNLLVLAVVVACLTLFLGRTSLGLQMRAVASHRESAALTGIPVQRILLVSWGIAGVIGGIAAALIAPESSLSTQMMFDILLYALAAATLGGLDSIKGAALGGLIVAVVTALLAAYVPWIGQGLKQAAAMALIVVVLLVRPAGLFGTQQVRRV